MKSLMASLRSLTLPFGTTSGARIELDGINGEIRIYDVNNDLLLKFDNEGIIVYDAAGNIRMWIGVPGGSIADTPYSIINFFTERTDQLYGALISVYDVNIRNRMIFAPGNHGRGSIEWSILPEDVNGVAASMLQAVCYSLSHVGNLRPYIDLTGANSQAGNEPRTVVNDLWYGTPNNFSELPTLLGSYGKGVLALGTNANDVVLSTTVGVASTLVGAGNISVLNGRRYRIMLCGGHSFLTGGSGFAVGDAAEFFLERDAGGGYAEIPLHPARIRIRANVAIAARWAMPVTVAYYEPATNATVDFRARAVRTSGASTVDMQAGTNSGSSPFYLEIADVGGT